MPSDRALVEIFHLHFLRILSARDKDGHCILKGGCNLRFFFGSVRYSEDVDLDVTVTAPQTLQRMVDQLLASQPLARLLDVHQLAIQQVSKPKQTETVQRWKVSLSHATYPAGLPTKIEFSRRRSGDPHGLERIDQRLTTEHRIAPFTAMHYTAEAALTQKVTALAARSEVQARDVFDLAVLLPRVVRPLPKLALAHKAAARLLELSHSDYVAQVLAYLPADERELRDSPEAWATTQEHVLEALQAMEP